MPAGVGHVWSLVESCEEDIHDHVWAEIKEKCSRTHTPTPDTRKVDGDAMARAVEEVARAISDGKVVYVHCMFGHGRSAVAAATLLAHCEQIDFEAALEKVRERRPCVNPSPEQIDAAKSALAQVVAVR